MGLADPRACTPLARSAASDHWHNSGTDFRGRCGKPASVPPSQRADHVRERRERFGDVVREHRLAAGLSQEALAERCGVDRKSISRMETGAFSPRLDSVFNVAEALNIPVSELFEVIGQSRGDRGRGSSRKGS
jgi:putative transcriptional regulator